MRPVSGSSGGMLGWMAGSLIGALLFPFLFLLALVAGLRRKPVDVGLGPHPLLNNVYHSRALKRLGYSAETFVYKTYFITSEFDIDVERRFRLSSLPLPLNRLIAALLAFALAVWRYRLLYIYFNGGPLAVVPGFLPRCEAFLYRLARVRIVAMPYGSDIHVPSRNRNLFFKHTMGQSYPGSRAAGPSIARSVDYWTRHADHIISGVEWVDYMPHWDTLTLGHFSIDTEALKPALPGRSRDPGEPMRIVHATNHRAIKGTDAILAAIDELGRRGRAVEFVLMEKRSNAEVLAEVAKADLVVDQLVMGWYALFAIEAMALGKPVVCNVRQDLLDLYRKAGLLNAGELPLIEADVLTIVSVLEAACDGGFDLEAIGRSGRAFVERRHSLDAMGAVFDRINRLVGVEPRGVSAPQAEASRTS